MKIFRPLLIVVGVVAVLVGLGMVVRRARAQETAPPKSMPISDAIRVERDILRLRELWAAEKPYADDAAELLGKYKVTLPDVLSNRVGINSISGEITRPQAAEAK